MKFTNGKHSYRGRRNDRFKRFFSKQGMFNFFRKYMQKNNKGNIGENNTDESNIVYCISGYCNRGNGGIGYLYRCECLRREDPYKFGDVFTNEINYWMVVGNNGELRPVILSEDEKKIEGFVGYYNGSVSTIKPFARYLGNFADLLLKEEKIIMNFCGCDVVLRTTDSRLLDRAEKEIKRIFDKEFPPLNKRELRKIVERDLGVKKHWFWGWIKND
jgi:hypothetical protein